MSVEILGLINYKVEIKHTDYFVDPYCHAHSNAYIPPKAATPILLKNVFIFLLVW